MAFFRYWRDVLWMAARHSLDHTQTVLFVAFLVVGGVAAFVPAVRPMMNDVSGWAFATGAMGCIIVVRLLFAPYWLDKEKTAALRVAETVPKHGDAALALKRREIDAIEVQNAVRTAEIWQRDEIHRDAQMKAPMRDAMKALGHPKD
jgi:hypothetical protein